MQILTLENLSHQLSVNATTAELNSNSLYILLYVWHKTLMIIFFCGSSFVLAKDVIQVTSEKITSSYKC